MHTTEREAWLPWEEADVQKVLVDSNLRGAALSQGVRLCSDGCCADSQEHIAAQQHQQQQSTGARPLSKPDLSPGPAAQPGQGHSEGSLDELDTLLNQYDAQAAADTREVQTKREKPLHQKGMAELRSEGLARTLGADNKGFKLLQQMGYRAGEGLGKDSSGRADPLDLVLKPGRTGLGVDEACKRKDLAQEQQQLDRALKRSRGEAALKQSFQQQQAAQFAARRTASHVSQAREVCEVLDKRAGLHASVMWPLPPPEPVHGEDEPGEEQEVQLAPEVQAWEDLPATEKLSQLLSHLRLRHHHCLFCGVQYKDDMELAALCPGENEHDH